MFPPLTLVKVVEAQICIFFAARTLAIALLSTDYKRRTSHSMCWSAQLRLSQGPSACLAFYADRLVQLAPILVIMVSTVSCNAMRKEIAPIAVNPDALMTLFMCMIRCRGISATLKTIDTRSLFPLTRS